MSNSSQSRSLRVELYRCWRSLHDILPPPAVLRQMRRECRRFAAGVASWAP